MDRLFEEWQKNPEIKIVQKPQTEIFGRTFLVKTVILFEYASWIRVIKLGFFPRALLQSKTRWVYICNKVELLNFTLIDKSLRQGGGFSQGFFATVKLRNNNGDCGARNSRKKGIVTEQTH